MRSTQLADTVRPPADGPGGETMDDVFNDFRGLPAESGDDADDTAAAEPDYAAMFGTHLSARVRALGWTVTELVERTGITQITVSKALNGSGASLDVAAKLARAVKLTLPRCSSPTYAAPAKACRPRATGASNATPREPASNCQKSRRASSPVYGAGPGGRPRESMAGRVALVWGAGPWAGRGPLQIRWPRAWLDGCGPRPPAARCRARSEQRRFISR